MSGTLSAIQSAPGTEHKLDDGQHIPVHHLQASQGALNAAWSIASWRFVTTEATAFHNGSGIFKVGRATRACLGGVELVEHDRRPASG